MIQNILTVEDTLARLHIIINTRYILRSDLLKTRLDTLFVIKYYLYTFLYLLSSGQKNSPTYSEPAYVLCTKM